MECQPLRVPNVVPIEIQLKTKEAIEALKQGKRIKRVASDPPVNLCDHLDINYTSQWGNGGFFQLCHQDKVIKVIPDTACAGTVRQIHDLEKFAKMCDHSYINFEVYEEPA